MLYVVYGEDTVLSRKKISELLSASANVVRLDGKKATLAEIEEALICDSLFSDKKTVVIEQFGKVKQADKVIEIILNIKDDKSIDVILWDEGSIPAKLAKAFKSAQSFSYDFPKLYFQFMDNLSPKFLPASISTLSDVLKSYEPEQILYSIIKRLRQLMVLKSTNSMEFSEFARMQEWQLGKLRQQASKWTEEQLNEAFLQYTNLDEKIKTGSLTMDLRNHLDILLMSDL